MRFFVVVFVVVVVVYARPPFTMVYLRSFSRLFIFKIPNWSGLT